MTIKIDRNDALLLTRTAVILHNVCLQKVEPFPGSFSPECLTTPAADDIISFSNVILQGPSILSANVNNDDNMDLDARMQIAATISQLLIYSTCSGTHHARQTSTIRHGEDQETHLPLFSRSEDARGSMAEKIDLNYTCTWLVFQSCHRNKASDSSSSMQTLRSGEFFLRVGSMVLLLVLSIIFHGIILGKDRSHWHINSKAASFICNGPLVQLEEWTTLFAHLSDNRPVQPLHHLVHCAEVKD